MQEGYLCNVLMGAKEFIDEVFSYISMLFLRGMSCICVEIRQFDSPFVELFYRYIVNDQKRHFQFGVS